MPSCQQQKRRADICYSSSSSSIPVAAPTPPPSTSTEARFKRHGIVAGIRRDANTPSLRRFNRVQSYKANFSKAPQTTMPAPTEKRTVTAGVDHPSTTLHSIQERRQLKQLSDSNSGRRRPREDRADGGSATNTKVNNWTLKEVAPALGTSSVQRNGGHITVIPVDNAPPLLQQPLQTCSSVASGSLRIVIGSSPRSDYGSMRSETLTTGQLNLVKSDSFGRNLAMTLLKTTDGGSNDFDHTALHVKRQSSSARRKSLSAVFSEVTTTDSALSAASVNDKCCCCCCKEDKTPPPPLPLNAGRMESSGDVQTLRISVDIASDSLPSPPPFPLPAIEICDEVSTSSLSTRSEQHTASSSTSSSSFGFGPSSCPVASEELTSSEKPAYVPGDLAHRRQASWRRKPMYTWTTDDIITWLQCLYLDEAASVLVVNLGIADERTQNIILREIELAAKLDSSSDVSSSRGLKRHTKQSGVKKRSSSGIASASAKTPLFNLVRSSSYDQIIAVELALSARDLSVAEGFQGCLQVTKVRGATLPIVKGDCILEINSISTQNMPAVRFTKILSESSDEENVGGRVRLVVLRRSIDGDDPMDVCASAFRGLDESGSSSVGGALTTSYGSSSSCSPLPSPVRSTVGGLLSPLEEEEPPSPPTVDADDLANQDSDQEFKYSTFEETKPHSKKQPGRFELPCSFVLPTDDAIAL